MGSKNGKPVLTEQTADDLSMYSGLTPIQIREHFDAFVAEHPSGKMNKKDFREMMSKALPKKDASKMESHLFRVYDTSEDGVIEFIEFMVVYYIMTDGTPQEVLERIFRVFDVNSDGTITKKELKRLIKDMYGLLKDENAEQASQDFITKSAFAEMDQVLNFKISS
ncbi:neuronal calcium sensor 2 [Eurytemora carolleeae]|uniref:neuronal calcium sensor 2 n=1 Tax=Eurytemora carolleeae TaxID=1294199 RepID=UPI000C763992|nr:neuronal calcium sensor 2 [Eurytemora carolleeae]|eukprot:XP_023345503.1 neuronal calcium sensor 2-like [Eurytemora affinis]